MDPEPVTDVAPPLPTSLLSELTLAEILEARTQPPVEIPAEAAAPEAVAPEVAPTENGAARTVSLMFRKNMASGRVQSNDGPPECIDTVQVDIERMRGGEWTMVRSTQSSSTGAFRQRLPNSPGKYRATTPASVVGGETFEAASSKPANFQP